MYVSRYELSHLLQNCTYTCTCIVWLYKTTNIVIDLTNVLLYSIVIQCICIPVMLHCKYFTIYSSMSYQSVCDSISCVLFRNNLYS